MQEGERAGSRSVEAYKLKRLLDALAAKKGRHTELITLYIPPGRQISEVVGSLRQEYGTASNIKSRTTRHNVQDAIERVIQRLKLFRETPPTGLAVFCGATVKGPPGTEELETHVVVPPEPINTYLYRCDSQFHLGPLYDMIREKDTYGILVMDGSGATFATLRGRSLEIAKSITSGISSKHRAGGQSARRFERLREVEVNEFYKRVASYAAQIFLGIPDLKGLIVGGPGPTKHDFIDGGYLHYELRKKILAVVDTAYVEEQGVKEVVSKAPEIIQGVRYVEERRLVQQFLSELGHDSGLAAYGEEEVKSLLADGAVGVLLLSEELDRVKVEVKCGSCDYREEKVMNYREAFKFEAELYKVPCPSCGSQTLAIRSRRDVMEAFMELAEKSNVRVEIISNAHEEGEMLYKSFGGVVGILRYPRKR